MNALASSMLSAGSVQVSNGGTLNQSGGSLSTGAISVTGSGLHSTEENTQYTALSLYAEVSSWPVPRVKYAALGWSVPGSVRQGIPSPSTSA